MVFVHGSSASVVVLGTGCRGTWSSLSCSVVKLDVSEGSGRRGTWGLRTAGLVLATVGIQGSERNLSFRYEVIRSSVLPMGYMANPVVDLGVTSGCGGA